MARDRAHARRLLITFVAFIALMFGAGATQAYASGADGHDTGKIQVCKKLQGPGDHLKFDFTVRKDGHEVAKFSLKKNECRTVEVKQGKYTVTEYVPKNCELVKIEIDGSGRYSLKDATAWVEVEKDKTVKVTFFDKCKRDDCG